MKIVIAPDSYKESLSALDVATAIEAGFKDIYPDADYYRVPVADGGEGTVDAMVAATQGKKITVNVTGPLGEKREAFFGISGDGTCAFIEMAAASGLELVPADKRAPLKTTSYGTGELIRSALDYGVRHCIIGIGGSATNDGGAGMVQALGGKLLTKEGEEIGFGGGEIGRIAQIDISNLEPRLKECKIEVACDVTNPLTGNNGASVIFGPQKGATAQDIAVLDKNLTHFAEVIQRDLNISVESIPGSGAAGGLGAGLLAFCHAELRQGIEIVTEALGLASLIEKADLVITGEGRMDSQSINGKVPVGVAKIAKRFNKPVIGIAGSLSEDVGVVHDYGVDAVFSVLFKICTLNEAMDSAYKNIFMASRNIAAVLKLGESLPYSMTKE